MERIELRQQEVVMEEQEEQERPLMSNDDDVENDVDFQNDLSYSETEGNEDNSSADSPPSTPADEAMMFDPTESVEDEDSSPLPLIISVRSLSGTKELRNVEDSHDIGSEGEPVSSSVEEFSTTSDNANNNNYCTTSTWEEDDTEASEADVAVSGVSLSDLPGQHDQDQYDVSNKGIKVEEAQKRKTVIRYCSSGAPKEVVDLTEDDDEHEVNKSTPSSPSQRYPNESLHDLVNEQDGNYHAVESESSQPPTQIPQDTSLRTRTSATGIKCFNCGGGHHIRQCQERADPEKVKENEQTFLKRRRDRREDFARDRRVYLRTESPQPDFNNSRGYNERSGLWQTSSGQRSLGSPNTEKTFAFTNSKKSFESPNTQDFQYNDYSSSENSNYGNSNYGNSNINANSLGGGEMSERHHYRPTIPTRTKRTRDSEYLLDNDSFHEWIKPYEMYESSCSRRPKPVLTESTEYAERLTASCSNSNDYQQRVPSQLGFNENCPRSDRGVVNNLSELHVTHTETRTITGIFNSSPPRDPYNEFDSRPPASPPYPMGRGRGHPMVSSHRVSLIARASTGSSAQLGRARSVTPKKPATTSKKLLTTEETVQRLLALFEKYDRTYCIPEIESVPHNYHHTEEAEERYHARKKEKIEELRKKGLPVPSSIPTYATIPVYSGRTERPPTPPQGNNMFQQFKIYPSISNSTRNGSERKPKRPKSHTAVNGDEENSDEVEIIDYNDAEIQNNGSSEPSQSPLTPSDEGYVDDNGPEESNSVPVPQNYPIDEEDDSDIEVIHVGDIKRH